MPIMWRDAAARVCLIRTENVAGGRGAMDDREDYLEEVFDVAGADVE